MKRVLSPRTKALLRVRVPSARPALAELARRASADLVAMTARLSTDEAALLERFPLDAAVGAAAQRWRGHDHERPPAAFAQLARDLRAAGGDGFATVYGRLLLLSLLSQLPAARPRLRIPELVWEAVEVNLALLLDAVPEISAPDWGDQAFVKDVRAAQLHWLPYDGMVLVDARTHPWYLTREAGWRDRLAFVRYAGLLRGFTAMEGHEWRGYRERRREPWQTRMARTAALAAVNPSIAGALSRSWVNDPALHAISPALREKADGIVAAGGFEFRAPMTPEATGQALAKSEKRRQLYEDGKYVPGVYATFFKRSALLRWARGRWEADDLPGIRALDGGAPSSLTLCDLPSERPRMMDIAAEASAALQEALERLSPGDRERLTRVPLDACLPALLAWPPGHHYYELPPAVRTTEARAAAEGGSFLAVYRSLLLYSLLAQLPARRPALRVPEAVWDCSETGLSTLLAALPTYPDGPIDDDMYFKDLSLASLRAVCVGFHVYERITLAPRRLAARLRPRQRLALMRYLGRDYFHGGPYGSSHAWRGFRELRGKEAWEIRFLRIAGILEANPDLKGQFGSSWLSDPALQEVAPHLAVRAAGLRSIGAHSFPVGVTARATAHALATSETRRRLYAEGSYVPVEWATIAKRSTLLDWARSYRAKESSS